jgi:hypothetical protein
MGTLALSKPAGGAADDTVRLKATRRGAAGETRCAVAPAVRCGRAYPRRSRPAHAHHLQYRSQWREPGAALAWMRTPAWRGRSRPRADPVGTAEVSACASGRNVSCCACGEREPHEPGTGLRASLRLGAVLRAALEPLRLTSSHWLLLAVVSRHARGERTLTSTASRTPTCVCSSEPLAHSVMRPPPAAA